MKNTDKKTLRQRLRAKPQESEEYVRRGPNLLPQAQPDELEQPPEKPEYDGTLAPTEDQLVELKTGKASNNAQLNAYQQALRDVAGAARGIGQAAGASVSALAEAMRNVAFDPALPGADHTVVSGNPRVERRNDGSISMRVGDQEIVMRSGPNGLMRVENASPNNEMITATEAAQTVTETRASIASNDIAAWLGANLPSTEARVSMQRDNDTVEHHSIHGEYQRMVTASYTTLEVHQYTVRDRRMRDVVYLAALAVPVTLFRHRGAAIARHYADETANDPNMPRGLHVFQGHQEWVLGIMGSHQIFYYNVDGGCFLRAYASERSVTDRARRQSGGLERMIVGGYWANV